ncbi:hypothetical protein NDU88_002278 [Pleurodeles waltl]|uniref:Transmembrane protein n=1 Tax=Pleurodeles waltl TaxID=8319 RepID=A0AAV7TK99_PLEWA|nr:hypothetical protein NDU88_002278 [Pleurodeles waltl]
MSHLIPEREQDGKKGKNVPVEAEPLVEGCCSNERCYEGARNTRSARVPLFSLFSVFSTRVAPDRGRVCLFYAFFSFFVYTRVALD